MTLILLACWFLANSIDYKTDLYESFTSIPSIFCYFGTYVPKLFNSGLKNPKNT
jgi:hypothetical protein